MDELVSCTNVVRGRMTVRLIWKQCSCAFAFHSFSYLEILVLSLIQKVKAVNVLFTRKEKKGTVLTEMYTRWSSVYAGWLQTQICVFNCPSWLHTGCSVKRSVSIWDPLSELSRLARSLGLISSYSSASHILMSSCQFVFRSRDRNVGMLSQVTVISGLCS